MTFVPTIPSPVAQWIEPQTSGAAIPLARAVFYRDAAGEFVVSSNRADLNTFAELRSELVGGEVVLDSAALVPSPLSAAILPSSILVY